MIIPKKNYPKKVFDFRQVNLCNVMYKLISKVITNRLKYCMPNLFSPTQSAFVKGRLITDNVLVYFELMQYLKLKGLGKKDFMSLKLDMNIAYDCVE